MLEKASKIGSKIAFYIPYLPFKGKIGLCIPYLPNWEAKAPLGTIRVAQP